MSRVEVTIRMPERAARLNVLGSAERNLKMIREGLGVNIAARDDVVRLSGERDPVAAARRVLEHLGGAAEQGQSLSRAEVLDLIADASANAPQEGAQLQDEQDERTLQGAWGDRLDIYADDQPIRARSSQQQRYLDAMRDNDLVFSIGPAGTGKTYLAVAAAVHLLKIGRVRKAILVRPAVEAGEKLGFLPGDMEAKVNPYLRPLFDALHDMMDFATLKRFMINDVVEVAPLAFMRGRTLNDAIIILDEAQNTTKAQMQMLLTRMGQRTKVIVTGDTTQIDLPNPRDSGLVDASQRLRRIPNVAFVTLGKSDIVRHSLVQRIVEAYGEEEGQRRAGGDNGRASNAGDGDDSSNG